VACLSHKTIQGPLRCGPPEKSLVYCDELRNSSLAVGLIPAIHEPSGKSYRNHHRDQGIAIAQKYSAKLSKKAADKKLTEVAESEVNVQAMTD
jgi:hypothetical protein